MMKRNSRAKLLPMRKKEHGQFESLCDSLRFFVWKNCRTRLTMLSFFPREFSPSGIDEMQKRAR